MSEEEKDDFYEQLEEIVSHSRRHDLLLVMGDFSAKFGEYEGLREVQWEYLELDG